jgi:hypothetical protein
MPFEAADGPGCAEDQRAGEYDGPVPACGCAEGEMHARLELRRHAIEPLDL